MSYFLKFVFPFLAIQACAIDYPDLMLEYHVVNGQIVKKGEEENKFLFTQETQKKHQKSLSLKTIDLSQTIFVGQKQAVILDFKKNTSPYTCAVVVDACPCLMIGIKTKKKGAIIHFDEDTQIKSIGNYIKANFANQGLIDIYINGIDSQEAKKILDNPSFSQRERIEILKHGILSYCKKLKIKMMDNTRTQSINTLTNEQNTLGVSKDGFFHPFFYNGGVFYQQKQETIELVSEKEQIKVKEFLNIYTLQTRSWRLFDNYMHVEAPRRFGASINFNENSTAFPIDEIDVKKLIADTQNSFPNYLPIAHWGTDPV